jgi:predicted glycosyltransferase
MLRHGLRCRVAGSEWMDTSRVYMGESPPERVETAPPLPQRLPPEASRFLFYSHDGLGLGHVRRNLAIADTLSKSAPGATILIATSVEEVEKLGIPPGVDILRLPGLRKLANERYAARRLRVSPNEFTVVRAKLLAAAVESLHPSVLLVDKHPLGASGELRLALDAARAAGTRTVLGLRDILDDSAGVAREWGGAGLFEQITKYYDRVLIYGQPHVFDPIREYAFPNPIAKMTHFCGYVFRPATWTEGAVARRDRAARTGPLVLATAGGGEDGFALLQTFIEAVADQPWEAVAVSGPQCDAAPAERLRGLAAEAGVALHRFVPSLSATFGWLDTLVCMGGYNTLIEAVASGVPTVCVPRDRPRLEQLLRARQFARFRLLKLVEPHRLSPGLLEDVIWWTLEEEQRGPRPGRTTQPLDLDGARRAAHHLLDLAAQQDAPHRTLGNGLP